MERFSAWLAVAKLDSKKHQLEGMKWVLERESNPTVGPPGGFLCDEMGLGKTVMMIGAIMTNFKLHNLIVVPRALLQQWGAIILKWCGHKVLVYHGYKAKSVKITDLVNAPIVLTTYGMIATRKAKDYKSLLWEVEWDRLICDEAHHLRNAKSNMHKGARKLKASIKWMVTGTPINNGKKDFFNLCCIQGLDLTFRDIGSVDTAREIIRETVLRRTKKQVGIKMPARNTHRIGVKFESPAEESFARNIHNLMGFAPVTAENVNAIIQRLGDDTSPLPIFMLMRQVCVMPDLATDLLIRRGQRVDFDFAASPVVSPPTSSKIAAVVAQVLANRASGKRKLIFCQFRREIQEIKRRLTAEGMRCAFMDGSISKKERISVLAGPLAVKDWSEILMCKSLQPKCELISKLIDQWLTPDVLIVQIQTACEGLNLQHFAEIYFTTPHWNPAVEDQAIARSHRIGQKQDVDIYRFITTFSARDKDPTDVRKMSLDQYCERVQDVKRDADKLLQY